MKFTDIMMQETENLKYVIDTCGRMLKHLPKGKLSFFTRNGHDYYYKRVNGNKLYLPVGSSEIGMLSDRKMAELVMRNAKSNLDLMRQTIQNYKSYDPNELVKTLARAYQGVSSAAVNAMGFPYLAGYESYSKEYERKAKHKENLIQTAGDGTKRRSKSELIIDEIYKMLGYHALYEKPLYLPDGVMIVPDFTAWSYLRNIELYQDHIGLLSDPERNNSNFWKFQELVKFNYYPFDRVLYTFDRPDGSIDVETMTILIKLFMQ